MGLLDWLARKGAVGGTARWAANSYRHFQAQSNDGAPADSELFKLMISRRFDVLPNAKHTAHLLSMADHVQGLVGLVIEILKVESALHENTAENRRRFIAIIDDELKITGLAKKIRIGTSKSLDDYYVQAATSPSLWSQIARSTNASSGR